MAAPKKSLVWIASYPKSGNTWLRVFLCNYLLNRQTPMPINDMAKIIESDAAPARYYATAKALGKKQFDHREEGQVLGLRLQMLRRLVANGADLNFLKSHNFNGKPYGKQLIPPALTRTAIHVVRNPLDLAVSFADYIEQDRDEVIDMMCDTRLVLGSKHLLCTQYLCDWSTHTDSWTRPASFPVCTLRYEDLHNDPEGSFSRALEVMNMPLDPERLTRAIAFSSFQSLSQQEASGGFSEHSGAKARFFRAGKAGDGRSTLLPAQIDKLIKAHGPMMERFGYLR